jgi:hypothetical protein
MERKLLKTLKELAEGRRRKWLQDSDEDDLEPMFV